MPFVFIARQYSHEVRLKPCEVILTDIEKLKISVWNEHAGGWLCGHTIKERVLQQKLNSPKFVF